MSWDEVRRRSAPWKRFTVISLEEVRAHVLDKCQTLEAVEVPLAEALGCTTAAEVVALDNLPPFANSAMDGFALRSVDTAAPPVSLDIVGTIAAGSSPDLPALGGGGLGQGQAVRIMTGAPVPAGADAVVMVELTRTNEDGRAVKLDAPVAAGNHVRNAGEDVLAGQVVLAPGTALTPGHLGVLASIGLATASVVRRARVGVLSTGDELVADGGPLGPGQIRDSNRLTLLALVDRAGASAVDLGLVPDDEDDIRRALTAAVESCDLVLTSGGVSVGDFDYVKAVLSALGGFQSWQVAIKPAKPLAFALAGSTPVIGLAGNPVSSMVGFELFARPAIRKLMGHPDAVRAPVPAVANEAFERRPDGKVHLARVVARHGADGRIHVRLSGGQGSHMLWAMAQANALAVLPDGYGIAVGGDVEVLILD